MLHRRLSAPKALGGWFAILLPAMGFFAGCDVLNPALMGTVSASSVGALSAPEGTILIAVLNSSSAIAAVRVEVVKEDGGVVDLVIPVQPADGDPANESDHAIVVQDCDVASIQLLEVIAALPTGGVQQLASDQPPLLNDVQFSCGKVVVIMITGTPPNLLVEIAVL